MKAVWRGTISFGLVSINVELFPAIENRSGVSFELLHTTCHTPLQYKRWCPHCNKEVAWEDTVKGLKMKDGSYFIVTAKNMEKLKEEKNETLTLLTSINIHAIDPLYYNNHYYVVPEKKSEHAYFLFAHTLQSLQSHALGHFVMHQKEHLCIIRPYEQKLLLTTLHYTDEIRPFPEKITKKPVIDKQELHLAQLLIKRLSRKKMVLSSFKDRFLEKLTTLIKKSKHKGRSTTKIRKEQLSHKKVPSSLLTALKASLGNSKSHSLRSRS